MKTNETIEHEGRIFEKIQFQEKAVYGRKFTDCRFKHCRLNMLSFEDCSFKECVFEDCDLSLIKVKGSFFSRCRLERCKAIGIHWFDAGNPFSVQFLESNISYSSFFGKTLKKSRFVNCLAKEVDFSECLLCESEFGGTDLEGARFSDCDLTQANFKGALHYHIDLQHNKVKKTKFSLPEALSLLDPFDILIE